MKVVSCGERAGVAHEGYRSARLDGFAELFEELLVVAVDGYDVVGVLDDDDIALAFVPAGVDDETVIDGADDRAGRCGDVDGGMQGYVESLGHHALDGGEEVHPLDRQVPVCTADAELLLKLNVFAKYGVAAVELFLGFGGEVFCPVGAHYAVDADCLVAGEDAGEILGIEVPFGDDGLERVDAYGIGNCDFLGVCVRIARYRGTQGSESDETVDQQDECYDYAGADEDAVYLGEADGAYGNVGVVLDERDSESLVPLSRILSSHTFELNLQ